MRASKGRAKKQKKGALARAFITRDSEKARRIISTAFSFSTAQPLKKVVLCSAFLRGTEKETTECWALKSAYIFVDERARNARNARRQQGKYNKTQ